MKTMIVVLLLVGAAVAFAPMATADDHSCPVLPDRVCQPVEDLTKGECRIHDDNRIECKS